MKFSVKLSIVLFLFLTGAVGCSKSGDKDTSQAKSLIPSSEDLNVVIILADALRADHLPFYGYKKDTAPFLSTLTKKSILFEKAMATAGNTAPAIASMFTAFYPYQHGVITGYLVTEHLRKAHKDIPLNRIPQDFVTIGEVMKTAGYKTYLVADNLNISEKMGYTQGFDKHHTYSYKGAEVVNDTMKKMEKDIKSGGKYFLYLHYMDPHAPYNRKAPWFQEGEGKKENTVNAYDSEINYTDQKIKEMFDLFGWKDNSLVIFIADHGEEFWEHGLLGHGKTSYTQVLHVPFFVYHPQIKDPKRISDLITTMDLMPTLCDILNLPKVNKWEGQSLLPLVNGGDYPSEQVLAHLLRSKERKSRRSTIRSIFKDDLHYIETLPPGKKQYNELFDLKQDWAEENNIIAANESKAAELSKVMRDKMLDKSISGREKISVKMDEEQIKHLETLGYVD